MDPEFDTGRIRERLGEISATAAAAHQRLDRMEVGTRADLGEIKQDVKGLILHVQTLDQHVQRGKGWSSAMIFIGSVLGSVLSFAVGALISYLKGG